METGGIRGMICRGWQDPCAGSEVKNGRIRGRIRRDRKEPRHDPGRLAGSVGGSVDTHEWQKWSYHPRFVWPPSSHTVQPNLFVYIYLANFIFHMPQRASYKNCAWISFPTKAGWYWSNWPCHDNSNTRHAAFEATVAYHLITSNSRALATIRNLIAPCDSSGSWLIRICWTSCYSLIPSTHTLRPFACCLCMLYIQVLAL